MIFCLVNKPIIVNIFVLHALHRKITRLAIVTRKVTKKNENLKCGGSGKEPQKIKLFEAYFFLIYTL